MLGKVLPFISVSFLLIFMQGCKPSLPSDILSRGEMEDVMYDYHLSKSLASQQGNPGEWERIYEDAVLRKHGITQEQFDRSLTYYMRHTDELSKIYDKLEDRLRAEAGSLGVSTSELGSLGTLGATGDTANVWSETRSLTLIPQALLYSVIPHIMLAMPLHWHLIAISSIKTECAMLVCFLLSHWQMTASFLLSLKFLCHVIRR